MRHPWRNTEADRYQRKRSLLPRSLQQAPHSKTLQTLGDLGGTACDPQDRRLPCRYEPFPDTPLDDRAEQKLNAQQAEITAVGDKVNAIQEAFTVEFDDWRDDVRSMVGKIAMTECGDYSGIESVYQRAYDALEYRAGVCLTARVRNKKNRLLENGATKTAIKAVSVLDIINDDKKLREIFTAILREMLAKEV